MKFGIMNAVRQHPAKPVAPQAMYADYVDDAVRAEELGFEFSWYSEHHFRPCQWTPSPLVVCAAVAAKTETLRVGTAIIPLPFHDPLRIAEDAAVVDAISGGRLDLGLGVGSQYEEFKAFNVDSNEKVGRLWEGADLIERCFTSTGPFSHRGRYYDVPEVDFTTRPVQRPIPIWIGASGTKNVERTAQRGWNLLSRASSRFDEVLTAKGKDPAAHGVAPPLSVCVADTTEEAWELAEEGLLYAANFYATRRRLDGSVASPDALVTPTSLRELPPSAPGSPMVGNPDEIREQMVAVANGSRGRVTHLPLTFRHPGMGTAETARSMELFAQEVVPALR